jgi:gliding motility-associated lipoprotein GldH
VKRILIPLLLLLILTSCGETPLYKKTYDFKNHTWGGGESPKFTFKATDTSTAYNFVLTLRTTTEYEFSNLWVFMFTENPDKSIRKDTLNFPLAEKNGAWMGKNSGSVIENEFLIGFNKKFPHKGEYTVRFEQAITQKDVGNILDLTFEVSKTVLK